MQSMCRADALLVEARLVRRLDRDAEVRVLFWRQGRPQSISLADHRAARVLEGQGVIGVYAPEVGLGQIADDILASLEGP